MWNLGEYRKHPQRLADHLPWATFIAPGVMLNKDGSLQKTVAFPRTGFGQLYAL